MLSAAGGWPSTSVGAAEPTKTEYVTNDVDLYEIAFDGTTDEFAQWSVLMPGDWDGGSVTATFYWTAAAGSGTVIWYLQGRSYGDNEALDQAWGTEQIATDTIQTVAYMHISPVTPAITLAGTPAAGEWVQFRAYRDASVDTSTNDAELLGVKVVYTLA